MLRKFSLAFVAAVALAGAGLSSTAASAAWHGGWHHGGGWHGGGWHGGGWHRGWYGPRLGFGFYPGYAYAYGPGCYIQRRYVHTRFGLRLRRVRVCY